MLCFVVAMIVLLGGGAGMKKKLAALSGYDRGAGRQSAVFTKADIIYGQNVYQRFVLMDRPCACRPPM